MPYKCKITGLKQGDTFFTKNREDMPLTFKSSNRDFVFFHTPNGEDGYTSVRNIVVPKCQKEGEVPVASNPELPKKISEWGPLCEGERFMRYYTGKIGRICGERVRYEEDGHCVPINHDPSLYKPLDRGKNPCLSNPYAVPLGKMTKSQRSAIVEVLSEGGYVEYRKPTSTVSKWSLGTPTNICLELAYRIPSLKETEIDWDQVGPNVEAFKTSQEGVVQMKIKGKPCWRNADGLFPSLKKGNMPYEKSEIRRPTSGDKNAT